MAGKPTPKPDNPEQSKRFIEAAKQLETNEDPKAFEKVFKKVASRTPKSGNR
jgi:hypothetical protein